MSKSPAKKTRAPISEHGVLMQLAVWSMVLVSSNSRAVENPNVRQVPAGRVVTQQQFKALEGQIKGLKSEIEQLRRRLDERDRADLKMAPASVAGNSSGDTQGSLKAPFVHPWKKLSVGMTYSNVIAILGTPNKVNAGVITEVFYSDRGFLGAHLTFSENKLVSWTPPE